MRFAARLRAVAVAIRRLSLVELQTRVAHGTQARARILHQASPKQPSNRRRNVCRERAPVGVLFQHRRENVRVVSSPLKARLPVSIS